MIVHVSLDQDIDVIKVDVDWNSLPPLVYTGYEVIVDFAIGNFTNNKTFWTDSNGLEMQKRILNYRPTWNLSKNYEDSLENVTANYFPINTAIQLKDINSDRVFTVMNDRPQGGSALKEGAVQFMQNRRIPADDARGMGEWVDEKDKNGNGIRVPASYYIDIFRENTRRSHQRLVQHKTDDPAQFFFSSKVEELGSNGVWGDFGSQMKKAGVVDTVKMVSLPIDKSRVLLRFENLDDLNDKFAYPKFVNLTLIAEKMWSQANGNLQGYTAKLTEMSLSANMELSEMLARKIMWRTVDDETKGEPVIDYTLEDPALLKLEPQRIRVIKLEFVEDVSEPVLFLN